MRKVPSIAVVIGAALVLAAPASSWAQKGPIEGGLILPETGPLSPTGGGAAVRAETLVSSGEARAERVRGR